MKKFINLNYIWSKVAVDQMAAYGLKHVCISPGSRSTPLATAFSENKKIIKHVIVDERSCAYFALGLAKESGIPAAIVTTSGTAAVNLYPAIVEAYLQRVPLIVCTADRPASLRGTGANQTINQNDLYKNHIRFSSDLSLPQKSVKSFQSLQRKISAAYNVSSIENKGPVHLNFQFDKPLEKSSANVEIDEEFLNKINDLHSPPLPLSHSTEQKLIPKTTLQRINKSKRGLILVGWDNYEKGFQNELLKLSSHLKYPLLADGASGFFFGSNHKNIIVNHQAFLRSEKFSEKNRPDIIFQFGNPPTSNTMLDYLKNSGAFKIIVNKFGERKDSGYGFDKIIKSDPVKFCMVLVQKLNRNDNNRFLIAYQSIDKKVQDFKDRYLASIKIEQELSVIDRVIKGLPAGSNVFVSNSTPIRDLEFFKSKTKKKFNLFVNRGASGIDGINSTAAGVAVSSKRPTILITGDLSLFHDTNGLQTIMKYSIPLQIVLINNGGGAIFGMLPVLEEEKIFEDYFFTPLQMSFAKLIKSYNGNYHSIRSFNSLSAKLNESISNRQFSLFEIKTDYEKAIELRKKYFRTVLNEIEKHL